MSLFWVGGRGGEGGERGSNVALKLPFLFLPSCRRVAFLFVRCLLFCVLPCVALVFLRLLLVILPCKKTKLVYRVCFFADQCRRPFHRKPNHFLLNTNMSKQSVRTLFRPLWSRLVRTVSCQRPKPALMPATFSSEHSLRVKLLCRMSCSLRPTAFSEKHPCTVGVHTNPRVSHGQGATRTERSALRCCAET